MSDDKDLTDKSSAENVAEHLEQFENEEAREQRYYSQEQPFSAEEMARVINEARLHELLAQSDEFLKGLSSEIEDFDKDDSD